MKSNNHINNKVIAQNNKSKILPTTKTTKKWYILAYKFLILFTITTLTVSFTDKKGYFYPDQSNDHTAKKWDAFYKFTEKDTVDVVLIGNSHCYSGIDPANLSCALGCNCFILASPGTTIMDSYFCLKEALTRTTPKIVIIETYAIQNSLNRKMKGSDASEQFQSFAARKNILQKLISTPILFAPDNYLAAWSQTIRNHEFIFRDREQIKNNIELSKVKRKKDNKLYLGRYVRFTTGIEDSTLAKYASLGAPVDGAKRTINSENELYVHKIVDLCKKKNITPIFVTIPMYYKHIANYESWHNTLASVIIPTHSIWYDMQMPYDTTMFDRDCFENTLNANQHMTYYGSLVGAYKIANFIIDSTQIEVPKRYLTRKWNHTFYGEDGYFENYCPYATDITNQLICKEIQLNNYFIDNCILRKEAKSNQLLLKIRKNKTKKDLFPDRLLVLALIKVKGELILTNIEIYKSKEYDTPKNVVYRTNLIKEAEIIEIKDIN